jgi:hypothetical protein
MLHPGHALRLVARGNSHAIRKAGCGAVKERADGQVKQGAVFSARVAQGREVFIDRHGASSQFRSGSVTRIDTSKM